MNLIAVQVKAPLVVINEQFRATLQPEWESSLSEYVGRSLLLGIRPEHLTLGLPAGKNFHGIVETVEALGNDTFIAVKLLDLDRSDLIFQVRVAPDRPVRIGEEVWLSVAIDKLHLFDPETTLAVRISE
jgi:multiple sugar transport system ATP-binding protein